MLAVVAIIGRVVVLFALLMFVPLAFAWFGHDAAERAFVVSTLVTAAAGLAMSVAARRFRRELQPRDGFLLVSLTWITLPAFGALPLVLGIPGLSVTDAYFEAVSGFTATGATVLSGLDALPLSINVWRCFLMFVGGLGIIVLAVAILPLLGVGGAQVFKAEVPGPMKDTRLTPRITETAKGLWAVYLGLSVLCALAYWLGGMTWLDAITHMYSTMSLGGFSSHDASFGYFDSPRLEAIAIVFMLIASMSFASHFLAFRRRSLAPLWRDPEARAVLIVMLGSVLLVTLFLWARDVYPSFWTALRYAAFNTISAATTAGYASTDYDQWPVFAPLWLLFLSAWASSSGSTGGGIKMVRALLLVKHAARDFTRILHPRAQVPVRLGGSAVENHVLSGVLAFMLVYGGTVIAMTLLLAASGLELVTAFSAVVAAINNLGPGMREVGPAGNYAALTDLQTWVLSLTMLLGRLELFTLLVVFTPGFWRK